jgi:hypothetical protein
MTGRESVGPNFLFVCLGILMAVVVVSCSPDHGLGPTVQGIRGTVRFQGAWPEDLVEVRVVVFETYPPASFFDLSGYSDPIPLLSDSATYGVELAPGEYGFVAVACSKLPGWDTECVLGFYHVVGEPETPQAVNVESGKYIEDVDIRVEFEPAAESVAAAGRQRIEMGRGGGLYRTLALGPRCTAGLMNLRRWHG